MFDIPIIFAYGVSAAIITTVLTVASIAMAAAQASAAANAEVPGVSTNAEGIRTAAKTLPKQREVSSIAQQGGVALRNGFRQTNVPPDLVSRMDDYLSGKGPLSPQDIRAINKATGYSIPIPKYNATLGKDGAKNDPAQSSGSTGKAHASYNIPQKIKEVRKQLYQAEDGSWSAYIRKADKKLVSRNFAVADFTGMGEADVQGSLARQYADMITDLGDKYGVAFIEEARKQLELSDPEGTAARSKMSSMIDDQINRQPDRPVADLLDRQVGDQLQSGRKLDAISRDVLDSSVQDAIRSRGGTMAGADFADPLQTGLAGEQRLQSGMQKAAGWLSSGATPEDVAFRREQQNLANLGAFMGGRTPQAEFANLSGAQQGAAPFNTGGAQLPRMDQNAGAASQQFAMNNYQTQTAGQLGQANPWMAGLSGMFSMSSALGSAGWKPLG